MTGEGARVSPITPGAKIHTKITITIDAGELDADDFEQLIEWSRHLAVELESEIPGVKVTGNFDELTVTP
ncbi:hypothetical protein IF188_09695 [Microbacterium sp. NEAU-LLC]|uniref:Uncharacterized protein n=1 Tax=Microbacterium helvum TaxID=2773713 RepID=A0ABR8NMS4_9MICO|nr:hypothetical protein [Microbacterium helvum]MBD3941967.1 hypothetical protein [Microbacterium helvum]